MADYTKMIGALEAMGKRVDHAGFADRMTDPDFAERVRQQLGTKHTVQDSAAFYNTYNPSSAKPEFKIEEQPESGPYGRNPIGDKKNTSSVGSNAKTALDYAYEHPGTAGLLALTPFLPFSIPGALAAGALGTGAHVIDRVQEEQLHPNDRPINYMEETVDALGSGVGSGVTHGAFARVSKGMSAFAKPYVEAKAAYPGLVAKYEADLANAKALQSNSELQINNILNKSREEVGPLRVYNTEDEILGTLPGSTPKQQTLAGNVDDISDDIMNELSVRGVQEHMYETIPKYRELGGVVRPSPQDALEYFTALKKPIKFPTAPKPPKTYVLPANVPGLFKAVVPKVLVRHIPSVVDATSTVVPRLLSTSLQAPVSNLGGRVRSLFENKVR